MKWDGVRAICFIDDKKVRMTSRTGNSCERQYPELSVIGHQIAAKQAVLDGEIAVLDKNGVSSFGADPAADCGGRPELHRASGAPHAGHAVRLRPALSGWLRSARRAAHRAQARAAVDPAAVRRDALLRALRQQRRGDAGRPRAPPASKAFIAKRATSTYESKRSRDWLKIKIVTQQEFIICGYTAGERDYFSSLVLGLYENGKLVYVGNVGTGFDQNMLEMIYRRIEPLTTSALSVRRNSADGARRHLGAPGGGLRSEVLELDRGGPPARAGLSWTAAGRRTEGVRARDAAAPVEDEKPAPAARPPLLSGKAEEALLTIDGQRLKFTHLNKVFFPAEGYTKRDLLNYYDAVADLLLPYLKDRPLSLKRYPDGITDDFFFQKDTHDRVPPWMRVEPIYSEHKKAPTRFVLADDRAALLYLTNLGCIDQNPWMSRVGSLECPDFMLIDLDPQGCEFDRIIEAAQLVRKKLDLVGLEGYPKTTGGDGMHIYVPLEPVYSYEQVRSFAEIIARVVAAERPDLFTTPRPVARREQGKVYFDYLQIGESKTIAAPYVVRAYPGAPVATPLAWREVTPGLMPSHFHIRNALDRFARVGDLFEPVLKKPQRLEPAIEKLEKIVKP